MLSGRLRRLKFLAYSILLWIVIAILGVLAGSLLNHARYPVMASIAVMILIALFWMWAGAALVVKRLHDLDWPGWHYVWMFLIPGLLLGGSASKSRECRSTARGASVCTIHQGP